MGGNEGCGTDWDALGHAKVIFFSVGMMMMIKKMTINQGRVLNLISILVIFGLY